MARNHSRLVTPEFCGSVAVMKEPVDLRILQANERTLLAWVRTGLALMAFGFVVARLALWLRHEGLQQNGGISLGFGTAVIAIGAACEVVGAIRFVTARRAILAGQPIEPGSVGPVAVASAVAAVGLSLMVYLLVVD